MSPHYRAMRLRRHVAPQRALLLLCGGARQDPSSQHEGTPPMQPADAQFFDPEAEIAVTERRLPHWAQSGTVCFLTWRTADSMPKPVLERWKAERMRLLRQATIDPTGDLRAQIDQLPAAKATALRRELFYRWDDQLDEAHGACLLKRPDVRSLVAESIEYFKGDRYLLYGYVIMPNHIHILAAFDRADRMLKQMRSWKRFSAGKINALLNRSGPFWQRDGFDHLLRHESALIHYQDYIANNPAKACLREGEFTLGW